MVSGAFRIEISRDIETFDRDWARLEADGLLTPFQTRTWLRPLYAILATGMQAKPLFVLVRHTSTQLPLMLLPLCVRRRFGFKMIEFADLGVSDYNAPLIARAFNPSAPEWAALWRDIVRQLSGGSILSLQKMPSHIEGRANPLVAWAGARPMPVGAWGVGLPATLPEYDSKVLKPTFRRELAKKERRVAKRGSVVFATAGSVGEQREIFAVLARQRQLRCEELGRDNDLGNPLIRRFRDALVEDASSASPVRLSALKVDGEMVATMFALEHRGTSHVIMTTFAGGDWKSCSPGSILIHKAIESCLAQGIRTFDLTIGDEAYKKDFGTTRQPLFSLVRPLTPFGSLLAFAVKRAVRLREAWRRTAEDVGDSVPAAAREATS